MRRGGVASFDEGLLLEAYSTLKNYISLSLQTLEDISEDDIVEVDHVEKVAKLLAIKGGTNGREYIRLELPYYYKLDYQQDTPVAKELDDVRDLEEDLLRGTEIVELEPVTASTNQEIPEGLGKDLYNALNNEQFSSLCDSFIQTEDGAKVGVFTPIIKDRLPEFYSQYFDSEEKRKNGLCITSVHFEVQEGEQLIFDEVVITKWLTCIYTGIFEIESSEEEKNILTIEKLLAKWVPREEVSLKEPKHETQPPQATAIMIDENEEEEDSEEESSEEDSEEESQAYQEESDSDSEEGIYNYSDEEEESIYYKKIKEEEEKTFKCEPLSRLFLDEEGKDFSLVVNSHIVKVHKYILSIRSSYFKVLFLGNFSDKNISEYDVSDFLKNPHSLDLFVYFLYHDTLENENFTPEHYKYQNLIDLEEFSQFVLSERLKSECVSKLISHSTLEQTVEMLRTSLEANKEEVFNIAHTILLKTQYPYFNGTIIDDVTTQYYQVMCTSLTLENSLVKLDYLNKIEQTTTALHPFILNQIKSQIENLHWFIANRASSLDNKFIRTLPQPVQELISRFFTHDNLGMASFEEVTIEE